MSVTLESDHVTFAPDHILNEWGDMARKIGEATGRSFTTAMGHTMRDRIEQAGFVDVVETKIKVPCNTWPKDPVLKQAGLLMESMLDQSIEGMATMLYTQVLKWDLKDVLMFTARARAEMKKKSNCPYLPV